MIINGKQILKPKGAVMKRPLQPHNWFYWSGVIKDPNLIEQFKTKGNERQRRELATALKYHKWDNIQKRNERS